MRRHLWSAQLGAGSGSRLEETIANKKGLLPSQGTGVEASASAPPRASGSGDLGGGSCHGQPNMGLMVGWLVGWLVGWMVGCLVEWLVG